MKYLPSIQLARTLFAQKKIRKHLIYLLVHWQKADLTQIWRKQIAFPEGKREIDILQSILHFFSTKCEQSLGNWIYFSSPLQFLKNLSFPCLLNIRGSCNNELFKDHIIGWTLMKWDLLSNICHLIISQISSFSIFVQISRFNISAPYLK